MSEEKKFIYKEKALAAGRNFTVTDVPPLGTSILLGTQHYLTMLGATVLIPLILCPPMGATGGQTAEVISSIFFVSGINTFIQTTIGDRLPIVQGGSFSYLPATFSIIFNPELQGLPDEERFEMTMRTIQGAVLIAGAIQFVIGYTGIATAVLRFISPVAIAPVIASIGLGLYGVGFSGVAACWPLGLTQLATVIIFVLYLPNFKPFGFPLFALFPVILAIIVTWSLGGILTAADVWEEGNACRTDAASFIITDSVWFRIPYPFQWGMPVFRAYAIIPMWGGMLAGMVESIGDYYSCANLSGAPPPTPGVISRGLGCEGIGLMIAGLIGTGNGTTSYSENIGAIAVTGVGSRVVVQCGGLVMIIISCFAKFGAIFATMPNSMTSGLYCALFGMIIAVGLSNLQHVDMNSPRNQFIVGFAIFNSMSVSGPGGWLTNESAEVFGEGNGAEILYAIFSTPMIIAFISAVFLDNTCPGTAEERGLTFWQDVDASKVNIDPEYVATYSLPACLARITKNFSYLEVLSLGKWPDTPEDGYTGGGSDIGAYCCGNGPTKIEEREADEEAAPEAAAGEEKPDTKEIEA